MNETTEVQQDPVLTEAQLQAAEKRVQWELSKIRNRLFKAIEGKEAPLALYALAGLLHETAIGCYGGIEEMTAALGAIHAQYLAAQPKVEESRIVMP